MREHDDLYQLLANDQQAQNFYASLPFEIQQGLRYSSEEITSFDALQKYVSYLK